jgi:hypothetical protein
MLGDCGLRDVQLLRHPRHQFQVGQGGNDTQVAKRYGLLEITV